MPTQTVRIRLISWDPYVRKRIDPIDKFLLSMQRTESLKTVQLSVIYVLHRDESISTDREDFLDTELTVWGVQN